MSVGAVAEALERAAQAREKTPGFPVLPCLADPEAARIAWLVAGHFKLACVSDVRLRHCRGGLRSSKRTRGRPPGSS
ncbi:hypothetical protein ACL02R_18095 [Streptomyces sp. MS19]|uniref:hypothetical protein n=1 Tax=Streptomyces sp. MS19 TaxID=3385972 RepID=UPI00399FE56E